MHDYLCKNEAVIALQIMKDYSDYDMKRATKYNLLQAIEVVVNRKQSVVSQYGYGRHDVTADDYVAELDQYHNCSPSYLWAFFSISKYGYEFQITEPKLPLFGKNRRYRYLPFDIDEITCSLFNCLAYDSGIQNVLLKHAICPYQPFLIRQFYGEIEDNSFYEIIYIEEDEFYTQYLRFEIPPKRQSKTNRYSLL